MRKTGVSGRLEVFGIAIGIFLVFQSTGALAADHSAGYSAFKFSGGVVSAFLIHEAAHELAARATGATMNWRAGDLKQPLTFTEKNSSKEAGFFLNASGLVVQPVGAEVILQYDKIDKNDSFVRGMMLWNIVNPIIYVIDYWFIHRTNGLNGGSYQGDLQGVEKYSSKAAANAFSATLLAVAAFQGYRFARTQSWAPDWLKGKKLDNLGLAPLPASGAMLSYTFEF